MGECGPTSKPQLLTLDAMTTGLCQYLETLCEVMGSQPIEFSVIGGRDKDLEDEVEQSH
jgi:hypothetical protein